MQTSMNLLGSNVGVLHDEVFKLEPEDGLPDKKVGPPTSLLTRTTDSAPVPIYIGNRSSLSKLKITFEKSGTALLQVEVISGM